MSRATALQRHPLHDIWRCEYVTWQRTIKVADGNEAVNQLNLIQQYYPALSGCAQIFIGRTVAKARIVWPPDSKGQFIGKDPDVGKDWRQKEKGAVEDEKGEVESSQHHRLNEHESEQTLGDSGGQRSLACCSPWGHKEPDTT